MNQSNELATPERFDPFQDGQSFIELLESRGHKFSIDTFTVATNVSFHIYQRIAPAQARHLTSSTGGMLDLGGGSWLYAATAYGTQQGRAISTAWSFEYKANEDRLEVQAFGRGRNFFYGVSSESSPIQFRKDISGKPTLILVRELVYFDNCSGEFCFAATAGSFVQFGDSPKCSIVVESRDA